mmetsp:Transcript_67658/g.189432  ORF Transcript_67658/g.189432 Transcript_67658/m.189432 type:complete len:375 (+) Transcript_67658:231-1355(+)
MRAEASSQPSARQARDEATRHPLHHVSLPLPLHAAWSRRDLHARGVLGVALGRLGAVLGGVGLRISGVLLGRIAENLHLLGKDDPPRKPRNRCGTRLCIHVEPLVLAHKRHLADANFRGDLDIGGVHMRCRELLRLLIADGPVCARGAHVRLLSGHLRGLLMDNRRLARGCGLGGDRVLGWAGAVSHALWRGLSAAVGKRCGLLHDGIRQGLSHRGISDLLGHRSLLQRANCFLALRPSAGSCRVVLLPTVAPGLVGAVARLTGRLPRRVDALLGGRRCGRSLGEAGGALWRGVLRDDRCCWLGTCNVLTASCDLGLHRTLLGCGGVLLGAHRFAHNCGLCKLGHVLGKAGAARHALWRINVRLRRAVLLLNVC